MAEKNITVKADRPGKSASRSFRLPLSLLDQLIMLAEQRGISLNKALKESCQAGLQQLELNEEKP